MSTNAPQQPRATPVAVVVTVIVCGTVVLLALVGSMAWLIHSGRDTAAMMTLVTATIVPLISAAVLVRVENVRGSVEQVRQQTNGTQGRLLDITERLAAPAPPTTPDTESGGKAA